MMGPRRAVAFLLSLSAALLYAENQKTFDVVSIRPSAPDADTDTRRLPGGRLLATGLTVKGLIRRGWDLQDFQVLGGPGWVSTDRYTISARAPEGTPADEPLNPFIQTLLEDRFGLKVRHEVRQLPALVLTVGKNGPKLHPSIPGTKTGWTVGRGNLTGHNVTMSMLAVNMLQRALNQWVTDATGIPGNFDITLNWAPAEESSGPSADLNAVSGPSVYTAIAEQLGLKLEARRGPVPVLVIESVHRPAEN